MRQHNNRHSYNIFVCVPLSDYPENTTTVLGVRWWPADYQSTGYAHYVGLNYQCYIVILPEKMPSPNRVQYGTSRKLFRWRHLHWHTSTKSSVAPQIVTLPDARLNCVLDRQITFIHTAIFELYICKNFACNWTWNFNNMARMFTI